MSKLPDSWLTLPLGEINQFFSNTIDPSTRPDEVFELFSVPSFPTRKPEHLPGSAIGSTKQIVSPGDVLVSKINPRINRVWTVGPKASDVQIASSEWIGFKSDVVQPAFANYYFKSPDFRELLCSEVAGVGGSLTRAQPKRVAGYPIPIAPATEQTRIANQLDTLLIRIQACNDRFDAIPALLKRFRQTVLDAYVLEDQLAQPVEKSTQPWALRTVGSVCASISDGPFGSNLKSDDYTSAGVQVVRLENIGHLFFDAKKETFISVEKYKTLSKHTLNKGDLLFSSFVDEEVRVCEFPIGTLTINKADCFRLRVDETQCNRHFLLYRLACKATYQSLKEQVHGATRPRINLTQLRGYEILLPPLAKQAEIVRRIEALFALADRIEARCTIVRAQAQRLTPLVLAKAFRGELVPQDPNDEPASALLARIGAVKTAISAKSEMKAARVRMQAERRTAKT